MPEQVPPQIGRYRIIGVLRHLETTKIQRVGDDIVLRPRKATLYRAHDSVLGCEVTIKVLSPGADLTPEELRALQHRFFQEARITATLSHPNIVCVRDVGEAQGSPYIVFEALEGRTLREAIDAGISLRAGLRIVLQVLDGLAFVHSHGVIHRDIQPDNIMVGRTGVAKIMNFGIARLMDSTLTKTGSLMGTPAHMSPEQASGWKIDGRSDIFSLGIILYELLTGRRPFTGDTLPSLMFAIIKEDPDMAPIPDGAEWKRLRSVVTRALQKKPEDRYPDAGAMRADLELAPKELGKSADRMLPVPR